MRVTLLTLVLAAVIALVTLSPRGTVPEPQQPPRFALLVGINEYQSPDIRPLRGTANDVRLMQRLLTGPDPGYGFRDRDLRILISAKAESTAELPTRANIQKAFREHLIENARAYREKNPKGDGAAIVFYYSGHGSWVDDQPTIAEGRDEPDGRDETLVPMDSDARGSRDIIDDEINAWFRELRRYTDNITFIFDSCHSGTATRGRGARSVERAGRAATRGSSPLNETMDAPRGYVTISGSLPNERAQESIFPAVPDAPPATGGRPRNEWYGYMTYYLYQTLKQGGGQTYRELMHTVAAAVNRQNPEQTPQSEGDIDRVFLGNASETARRAIAVTKAEAIPGTGGKSVAIAAGRLAGAMPGGTVAFYRENAAYLAGEDGLAAVGRITEATSFSATVRVDGGDVTTRSRAVLLNPYFTDEKRPVLIDAGDETHGLAQLLAGSDYVKPVSPQPSGERNWSVAIRRSKDTIFLEGPGGDPLYGWETDAARPGASERVKEALERHARVENILALNNGAGGGRVNDGLRLRVVKMRPGKEDGDQCRIEEYTTAEQGISPGQIAVGEYFYIEIANNTQFDLFMYLYNIDAGGAIQSAYAPEADGDIVKRGRTITTLTEDRCGGFFKAVEPIGRETFKLIATTKRFEASLLTQPSIARSMRSSGNPLEAMLAHAATNRRSQRVEAPFAGWGTARLDVEIVRR
jgi:hypothetical protein